MPRLGSLTFLFALAFTTTTTTACSVSLECDPSKECIRGVCQVGGCRSSIECDSGSLCYGGTCAPGKYVGEGENCAGRDRCWADLWCDYTVGTCKRYLDVGERCGALDRCEPSAVCNTAGVCAHYGIGGPAFAQPCYANDQCVNEGFKDGGNLVCRYGEFVDLGSSRRVWYSGGRICYRPEANHFGQTCADDSFCGLGLHCHWGVCLSIVVTAKYAPTGFACETNDDCCSQKCETRAAYRNGKRGQVRVCGLKDRSSPALPGCSESMEHGPGLVSQY